MRILHWGLLSTARINRAIIPPLRLSTRNRLLAVASRSQETAQAYAHEWHIPRAYGSYEALLDDPEIDVIYNPLPNHLHKEWTIRAMAAGKHVLCEKPMVLTTRELYPLLHLASQKQKILMPAWMYRFHPQWQKLKEMLSQNLIGKIQLINIHISYESKERTNIRFNKSLGGGVLNDIGCYALSALSFLFESFPLSLACTGLVDKITGVDTLTTGVLSYSDFQATFTVCMEMYRSQRLRIFGTHGMIDMEYPFNPPLDNATHLFLFSSQGEKTLSFSPFNPYTEEWKVFLQSMEKPHLPLSPKEMLKETFLLEQCQQALHKKKTILLNIPSQWKKCPWHK
jgi:predicted dehydrogenase